MKLSADKRNKLIGVAIITAIVLGIIWYFVIDAQMTKLKELRDDFAGNIDKQSKIKIAMVSTPKMEAALRADDEKLAEAEKQMASGDLYEWLYTTIKGFKSNYHVDIPQFGNVEQANTTLLPDFPYKQVKIPIAGSAFFNDLGKFVADFENYFPYIRIENLILEPASGAEREADREKLSFKMDVIALVNNASDADKK